MPITNTCAASLLAGILASIPVTAQELTRRGPKDAVAPQGPVITLQLVVLDAKGEPVRGLRNIDIDIRDDGKPMRAVFCRPLVTTEQVLAPALPREY